MTEALLQLLGPAGRMISLSKFDYRQAHPENVAIFNANVCSDRGKLWHGDLDLTLDEALLVETATRLGERLYVLYEMDARFANEERPLLDMAVITIGPDGAISFDERRIKRSTVGRLQWIPPKRRRGHR